MTCYEIDGNVSSHLPNPMIFFFLPYYLTPGEGCEKTPFPNFHESQK